MAVDSADFSLRSSGAGLSTAAVLLILLAFHLLRRLSRRRAPPPAGETAPSPAQAVGSVPGRNQGPSGLVSEADLRNLIDNLEGKLTEEKWEEVIDKKNNQVSYMAKCCRKKDGPLKYLSTTIFEKCSPELLRDFYMDNEYRKEWDKTLIQHEQLQVDESSGIEFGRTIKKFPLLTPREYVLAWCVWEGKDKTFYCFIKDCEHPMAPRQRKCVRVGFFRSGWRIRKVPNRDACEVTMVHQEDAGLNIEMAKLAFARGIWSYVLKMDNALRQYSPTSSTLSNSILTLQRIIQKVPPELENYLNSSQDGLPRNSIDDIDSPERTRQFGEKQLKNSSKKWIANGLLLVGGIACLSRYRSTLGAQLAVAFVLKKLVKPGSESGSLESSKLRRGRHSRRHYG